MVSISDLLQHSRVVPSVNQIEYHPLVLQPQLLQVCCSFYLKARTNSQHLPTYYTSTAKIKG